MANTSDFVRQVTNLVLIPIGMIVAMWPNSGPNSIGAISRASQPHFGAAGWAFSIWGLIFALQLAYAIYQLLPSRRTEPILRRIGWLTAVNALGGAAWTVAFVYREFTLAWLIMIGLLVNLIAIELRLEEDARSGRALWFVRAPYAINLGWISVAMILNTSQFLYAVVGWDGAPLPWKAWGGFVMAVALVLGLVMLRVRRNAFFPAVVAWAELAIAAEMRGRAAPLAVVGVVAALILITALLIVAVRRALPSRRLAWRYSALQ